MARFRCRACGKEGTFVYDVRQQCPDFGSEEARFAFGTEELPDDNPLIGTTRRLAKEDRSKPKCGSG
jgi:hypothetical protein